MAYGTYCTQIDQNGSGRERCGGACLASVMLNDGWHSDPWDLTVQVSDACGITDRGCTSDQLIACANAYGLDGRKWTYVEEAQEALLAGEAVLILCDNQFLEPRPYPMGYGWEAMHWIRAVAFSDFQDLIFMYDPLTYMEQKSGPPYQGPTCMDVQSVMTSIAKTPYAEAGVVLTSRKGLDLNRPPE